MPLDQRLQLSESGFSCVLQDWNQALGVEHAFPRVDGTIVMILGFRQALVPTWGREGAALSGTWVFTIELPARLPPGSSPGRSRGGTSGGRGSARNAPPNSPRGATRRLP